MTTEKMTYEEAVKILGVDENTTDSATIHTAYRVSSVHANNEQSVIDEALETVQEHVKEIEAETKPVFTNVGKFNIARIRERMAEEEARKNRLDANLPKSAPKDFKLIRGIVQHFPYRLLVIALFFGVVSWNAATMTIWSNLVLTLAFVMTVANTIYPFITRPLRYALIELVDNIFHKKYTRENSKEIVEIEPETEE